MVKLIFRKLYLLLFLLVVGSAIPIRADVDNPWNYVYANNSPMNANRNYVEFGYADWQNKGREDAFKNIKIYLRTKSGSEILLGEMYRCHDEMTLYNTDYGVLHVWGNNVNENTDQYGNSWVRTVYMRYYPGTKAIGNLSQIRIKGRWDIDDDGDKGDDHYVDESRDISAANRFEENIPSPRISLTRTGDNLVYCSGSVSGGLSGYSLNVNVEDRGYILGEYSVSGGSFSGTLGTNLPAHERQYFTYYSYYTRSEQVRNGSYGSKENHRTTVYQRFQGGINSYTLSPYPYPQNLRVSFNTDNFSATLSWEQNVPSCENQPLKIYRRKSTESENQRVYMGTVNSTVTTFTDTKIPDPTVAYIYDVVLAPSHWSGLSQKYYATATLSPTKIWNGDGTASNPYQIVTFEDLEKLSKWITAGCITRDRYWQQKANIDLGGETRPWTPMGNFEGSYDGQNYDITGLYVKNPALVRGGLFGKVTAPSGQTTTLKNIFIKGGTVSGKDYLGLLAGEIIGTVDIIHCFMEGTVKGSGNYIGGLFGSGQASVENSGFVGTVEGGTYVGGLSGSHDSGTVDKSYVSATVSGTDIVGKFVGKGGQAANYIQNYYNSKTENSQLKGFGTIGDGTQKVVDVAGVVAMTTRKFELGQVAWLLNGKQSESPVWYQTLGTDPYPVLDNTHRVVLIWNDSYCSNDPIIWTEGDGTKERPYLISTEAQLRLLADYTNGEGLTEGKYWQQTADIDLGGNARPCTSIGGSNYPSFKGNYDGQYHTISNLFTMSDTGYCGFFGSVGGNAQIEKVRLVDVDITGNFSVGGFIGCIRDKASAHYCTVTGKVSGSESVGGLTGQMVGRRVDYCSFEGTVSGDLSVGGLAGYSNPVIYHSYAVATVTGTAGSKPEKIGAFIGELTYCPKNNNTFYNCYDKTLAGSLTAVGFINESQETNVEILATGKTTEEFKSGAATWLLNGKQSESPVWYQTFGTDPCPVLDNTHKAVYYWGYCVSVSAIPYCSL